MSKIKLFFLALLAGLCFQQAYSQSTIAGPAAVGHFTTAPTSLAYVGWDANTLTPLSIRHDGAFPINFGTAGTRRMTILGASGFVGAPIGTVTYPFTAGNVGIGNTAPPLSMLQLGDITYGGGYRDWMQMGTSYNVNSDNMFVGLRPTANGADAIINWGNNPDFPGGPDRLRIVFTSRIGGSPAPTTQSSSRDGLEVARFITDGNVGGTRMGVGGDAFNISLNPYIFGADPSNTLEVNAPGAFAPNVQGASGLRFTDLRSNSMPVANPGTGVLSLDLNGDVILVPGTTGTGGTPTTADNGLSISAPNIVQLGGALIKNTDVALNNFNLLFSGSGGSNNTLAIGQSDNSSKLNVYNNHLATAGTFNSNTSQQVTRGILAYADGGTAQNIGGQFDVISSTAMTNKGITAGADGANTNQGGEFNANGPAGSTNYGIYSSATAGASNYGGGFNAYSSSVNSINYGVSSSGSGGANSTNYGVLGATNGQTGSVNYSIFGQGNSFTQSTNYAGYFAGQVYINGTIYGSDQRLKNNITDISNAMLLLRQLRPRTYQFNQTAFPSMNLSPVKQWGLIAQEVQSVWPELVSENISPARYDSLGNKVYDSVHFKGLNYVAIIPVLIKGMQEQQIIIDSQLLRLNRLENDIQELKNLLLGTNITGTSARGVSSEAPQQKTTKNQAEITENILNQNIPNPFTRTTDISYKLVQAGKAEIKIFNITGNAVATLVSENKNAGSYSVGWDAGNLPAGVYTYILSVNGRQVSKKALKLN